MAKQTYSINDIVYRGAIGKLFDLLKSGKTVTHKQLMDFKKANKLRSAYALMFRMRREGIRLGAFTIVVTNPDKPRAERTFRLVKGVGKDVESTWPKANPTRTAAAPKKATKKVAKKAAPKRTPVTVGADSDDEAIEE